MHTESGHYYGAVIRGHRIDADEIDGVWMAWDVDAPGSVEVALTEDEWATVPAWRAWTERQAERDAWAEMGTGLWDPGCGTRHPGGVCRC